MFLLNILGGYDWLWVLMGPYGFLCVLRVLMGPYRSL